MSRPRVSAPRTGGMAGRQTAVNAEDVTAASCGAVQFPCRAEVCQCLTHSCRFFDLCHCAALRALTRPTIVRSAHEIQRWLLRSDTCFARASGGPHDRIDGASSAWRAAVPGAVAHGIGRCRRQPWRPGRARDARRVRPSAIRGLALETRNVTRRTGECPFDRRSRQHAAS